MTDQRPLSVDRRRLLAAGGLAGIALPSLLAQPGAAAEPAGTSPLHTRTWLKLVADLSGRTRVSLLRGDVWGLLPQADDLTVETFARRIYGYWSLVARKAETGPDGEIRMKLKGWTFYLDPISGEPVQSLFNPYTNATVSSPPLSGPASTRVFSLREADGGDMDLTERRSGGLAWVHLNRVSRFKSADISWYKLELDLTSYTCKAADLDNPGLTAIPTTWSHNLVAEWQTWMNMHGAPGHILFKGDGAFIPGVMDAPPVLAAAIDRVFPGSRKEVAAW